MAMPLWGNGPVDPDERRVQGFLQRLNAWREGPSPPAPERFAATLRLLIERLEALEIEDDSWDDLRDP